MIFASTVAHRAKIRHPHPGASSRTWTPTLVFFYCSCRFASPLRTDATTPAQHLPQAARRLRHSAWTKVALRPAPRAVSISFLPPRRTATPLQVRTTRRAHIAPRASHLAARPRDAGASARFPTEGSAAPLRSRGRRFPVVARQLFTSAAPPGHPRQNPRSLASARTASPRAQLLRTDLPAPVQARRVDRPYTVD